VGFRNWIDLSPFDKSGNSAFGLRRENAKRLAYVFMFLGAMFLSPPIDPLPNDWLNFILAIVLVKYVDILSFNIWLLLTYIILGPALFFFGLWIYPYNTQSLLSGYINKAKDFLRRQSHKPFSIIIGIILFIITYKIYKYWLGGI